MIIITLLTIIFSITSYFSITFLIIQLYVRIFSIVLSAAYLSLTKRVFLALIHKRSRPAVTRAPIRILQPLVNRLKVLFKEPCIPAKSKKIIIFIKPWIYIFNINTRIYFITNKSRYIYFYRF